MFPNFIIWAILMLITARGVGLVAGREGGCAGEKEKKGAPKGDDGDDDDDDGGGGEDERSLPALGLLAGYDSSESE